jgi:hypothetical protein
VRSAGLIAGLLFSLVAGGCALSPPPSAAPVTPIGRDLSLRLPVPPGYAETVSLSQTATGRRGEQSVAFQAGLELSPERVEVVILAPAGPRVLTVTWDGRGVREKRTPLAPERLAGLNILGDIFVSLWPLEAVAAALPPGAEVTEEGGVRRIAQGGRTVLEVTAGGPGEARQRLRNLDFGYEMSIRTEIEAAEAR